MFESISDTLGQCGWFFLAGIIMGLFYEPLRFMRCLIRHNAVAVAVEDVLFLSVCAFVSFVISLVIGTGYFRVYYAAFELAGIAAYLLTLGRLIKSFHKLVCKVFRKALRLIFYKISHFFARIFSAIRHKTAALFGHCYKKVGAAAKKAAKHLPKRHKSVYNVKVVNKNRKVGESADVIKAKVRKKA